MVLTDHKEVRKKRIIVGIMSNTIYKSRQIKKRGLIQFQRFEGIKQHLVKLVIETLCVINLC